MKPWSKACFRCDERILEITLASASRISALGAAHKPQAATPPANSAGAADDASPFALLLNAVAAKTPAQSKDASQDDSAGADNSAPDTTANAAPDPAPATDPNAAAQAAADASVMPQAPLLLLNLPAIADDSAEPDDNAGDATVPAKPAKPASDSKSDDIAQAAASAPDMAAQIQLAMVVPAPVPVAPPPAAPATDSDDDTVGDVAAAASAAAPAVTPAAPAAMQNNPPTAKPAAAQTNVPQTSAPQLQSAQPVAPPSPPAPQASASDSDNDSDDDDTAPKAAAPKPAAKSAVPGPAPDAGKIVKADAAGANTSNPQQSAPAAQAAPPVQSAPQPTTQAATTIAAASAAATPTPAAAPAFAAAAQHVHVVAQNTVTPDVNALAVQIAAKSQSGARQFDIRLDPPELGRVDVRLSIDAGGKAQAHLTADQPATLDMLQKDAPVLTRALREAGLDVSQSGLNFSLRGQGGNQANADGGPGGRRIPMTPLQAIASLEIGAANAIWRGPADGRLDIRV